jgi:hypothetical protein
MTDENVVGHRLKIWQFSLFQAEVAEAPVQAVSRWPCWVSHNSQSLFGRHNTRSGNLSSILVDEQSECQQMNQTETTHFAARTAVRITVQHLSSGFEPEKMNFSIFSLVKAAGLGQVLDKMLELDISPSHLSSFDLSEYERLFERC